MFFRPLQTVFALALLIAVNVGPVLAEDPLPAGYERMLFPAADYDYQLRVPVWADYTGTWSSEFGTKGMRPTDVEIEWFDPAPDAKKLGDDPVWQVVSVVEVPNEGPFECEGWLLDVAKTENVIDADQEDQEMRPIDLDVYFRKDPYSGKIIPTYAGIWVSNTDLQHSDWDWIPATPYQAFMNQLDQVCQGNCRPYDIDFGVDENGQVYGMALLAPLETFSDTGTSLMVPTIWDWFDPSPIVLKQYEDAGWQLLDVEVPPDNLPGGPFGSEIAEYHELGYRFGIFVNTMFIENEDTAVGLLTDYSNNFDLKGFKARLIDYEPDGTIGGKGQAPIPTSTSAWLFGE